MCDLKTFQEILNEVGEKIWEEILLEKIKKIILYTFLSAKEDIIHSSHSFELFCLDLMVDEDYNVWLIEVNSSPAMDYSTKVTETLVKKGLKYLFKVIFDWKENKEDDTGDWELLYSGRKFSKKSMTLRKNLSLFGEKAI